MIEINVTQEDINKGIKSDCSKCPIALAANRVIPNGALAVGGASITYWNEKEAISILLPEIALKFIRDFDSGRKVKPFSFITLGI